MTRVEGEAALVLHARPYRESSAIVSLLTASHGRVAVVARGARGGSRGSARGGSRGNILQPFNRVRVGWTGRSNLVTLTACDLTRHAWLTGNALAAGFYVLELVTRLLPERESAPEVFTGACWALEQLESGTVPMDVVLRVFERRLLEELGYGLDFTADAGSGEPIRANVHYVLHSDVGFVAATGTEKGYPGDVLFAIALDDYRDRVTRVAAKQIFRRALRPLLGDRPLASRRLVKRERA